MIGIVIINYLIMAFFIYFTYLGVKAKLFGHSEKKKNKVDKDKQAYERAMRYGRKYEKTVDGGVIYPENADTKKLIP